MTTRRSLLIGVDSRGAHLELRHAADRIERVVRDAIGRRLAGPVKGNKNRVGTNVGRDAAGEDGRTAARSKNHTSAIGKAVTLREVRMNLGDWLRRSVDELSDAPRLRSRLIVSEQTAGRQIQRKLFVGDLRGAEVFDRMKTSASGRRGERRLEQARRTRVGLGVQGQNTPPSRSMRSYEMPE